MPARNIIFLVINIAYLILWVGGILSYVFWGAPATSNSWTASTFLLLASLIVVLSTEPASRWTLLGFALVGILAEWIGLRTGLPFGIYQYTAVLAPTIGGVPVAIAGAWLILGAYVKEMLVGFNAHTWIVVLCGGLWLTAIDLVIDPLAAGPLGYWHWMNRGIYFGVPALNFLGWLVVSIAAFAMLRHPVSRNPWAAYIGLSVILFFTIIAFGISLLPVGFVGIALTAIHMIRELYRKKRLMTSFLQHSR